MDLARAILQDMPQLLANHLQDLALINNGVEWISHLMRNGGVDQAEELPFSPRAIIKDLLWDVHKADHELHVLLLWVGFDLTFLDLKELELRDIFVIDALHGRKAFDNHIDVLGLANHLGDVILG
jgi:hypothetical protein